MGTACKEGSHIGIIPQAMAALFDKIESLKNQVEFQIRISFIEVEQLSHID
jgi:kinesin family protein 4/21/27